MSVAVDENDGPGVAPIGFDSQATDPPSRIMQIPMPGSLHINDDLMLSSRACADVCAVPTVEG